MDNYRKMEEPIIRFRDFSWQYNAQTEPTLREINLDIYQGEKLLICGPSGCGKSTLAHCLNGLIPFSYKGEAHGSLTLNGTELRELSIARISKAIGTVLQDSDGQFVGLTVAEDIAFALENDNDPQLSLVGRVREASRLVYVDYLLDHSPDQLSGGQKQRVSMAGVLVDRVPILLFDEPLANLDPASGKHSIELIDDIHRRTGDTVIIIEHRIEDVLHRDVDRIVLMNEGRIVAIMTPDELLSTSLLTDHGIREPLYITALKYAGVPVTPDMKPGSIRTLLLSEEQKESVRNWYARTGSPMPENDSETILSATRVRMTYPNGYEALSGLSLSIRKGEMISIVGKNGAGKSTFAKVLCGFLRPQEGRLMFRNTDLGTLSIKECAEHIGYVMQNPNQMISRPMIRDEVALGLEKRGLSKEETDERVLKVLTVCGLRPFRNWPVAALSYGQKKRVTIASILALDPDILILDEPTAGQDWRHYTEIMEFLKELNTSGVTVILITHDMHLMLEYCTRSFVFCDGRVLRVDTPAKILTDEATVEKARLKLTSLYELSGLCGIADGAGFTQCFISYEQELRVRKKGGAE